MIMMMYSCFITKEILTGPLPWAWWHHHGDEVLLPWHFRHVTNIPWLLKQNTSRLGRSGECRLHRCSPFRVCRRNGECSEQWAGIVMTITRPHSEHLFPAPSSKLCQIWLRHWRGTLYLRAAVHRHSQRPSKGPGTNMTVEATVPQART